MPSLQEAVDSAKRLSRTLSDLALLTSKIEELNDLERSGKTLEIHIAQRRKELDAATDTLAEKRAEAVAIVTAANAEAARLAAVAEQSAQRVKTEAEAVVAAAFTTRDTALDAAAAADKRLADIEQRIATRSLDAEKIETRISTAQARAASILKG
jgi:hypothetical protein